MKKIVSLFMILLSLQLQAQDSLVLIKKIPMQASVFTTDKAGSIYCAMQNNTIYRYDLNGDSSGFFNTVRRGKVTQIDATNPMRVLVFYADVPQLIVLDRMMSAKNNLDFKQMGMYNCPSISSSADGLVWAYHSMNAELVKIDDESKLSTKSQNLLQLFQTNIQPCFITEQERILFVIDTAVGILKFDQFGTYITTYPFVCKEMQYVNHQLIFYKDGEITSYNTQSIQEKKIKLPNSQTIVNARIERNRLYVLRKTELEIYNLL
jgi:hypothetical protein